MKWERGGSEGWEGPDTKGLVLEPQDYLEEGEKREFHFVIRRYNSFTKSSLADVCINEVKV